MSLANIVVMATERGIRVEVRSDDHACSVLLSRASVARLVVLLAQADAAHQQLVKGGT